MADNADKPMNILFLFADQMHAFAMGCAGTEDIHTPNLDRLAAEGVLFENAYSNCPVCTPFRANLFTGRHAAETGVYGNNMRIPEGERTLAASLNDGGYATSYVGKWHLGATGNVPIPHELRGGFTEFIGYQCYNDYLNNVCFYDETGNEIRCDKHRTDATTDIAIERLERVAERPFALFVSYQNPHYPEQPSPQYEAMYDGVRIRRRPNNTGNIEPHTPTMSPYSPRELEKDPNYVKYGGNVDAYLRAYYAMVTQLDANVGRMLDALDRLGLRENTAVVFTSDHGDMQGCQGLTNKCHPFEESSRIPLIVRVPGGQKGLRTDALVSGVDFFPTLIDYAGLPPEASVSGKSFAPQTLGEPQELNGPVFSEMPKWCMVRQGEYKLVVERPSLKPTHLYHMKADPYEMNNLVDDPHLAETAKQLQGVIADFYEKASEQAQG